VQDPDKSTSKGDNKESKPPPIFMAGVANVISLTILINKIECDIQVLNIMQVKIQSKISIKYISIVKKLLYTGKEIQIFTFT
jgi:hypothetical protein